MLRVAIEQYRIERSAFRRKLLLDGRDGTQVRRAQGPRHAMFIDFLRLNVFDIPRNSHLAHHGSDFFATLGRKLLGIVHAFNARIVGQHNGANGKRACDRASTHLVKSHGNAASCKFRLEAVHAIQTSRFSVFGGQAARSAFQGSLDPLALVGGKGAGKRLVFHAIRNLQCLSYFCKRLSHSFPSFLGDDSFSMRRSISHTQNRQRMPSKYTRRIPQRMENETRKGSRRTPSKAPIR